VLVAQVALLVITSGYKVVAVSVAPLLILNLSVLVPVVAGRVMEALTVGPVVPGGVQAALPPRSLLVRLVRVLPVVPVLLGPIAVVAEAAVKAVWAVLVVVLAGAALAGPVATVVLMGRTVTPRGVVYNTPVAAEAAEARLPAVAVAEAEAQAQAEVQAAAMQPQILAVVAEV
jgi:hypothetical protein